MSREQTYQVTVAQNGLIVKSDYKTYVFEAFSDFAVWLELALKKAEKSDKPSKSKCKLPLDDEDREDEEDY